MSERERLFFGTALDVEAAAIVASRQASLGRRDLPLRLVPEGNLHLTLRFIGDSRVLDRERKLAGIDKLALPGAFDVTLQGWGAFPKARSAKVIWIGVSDPAGGLQRLHEITERAAVQAGFPSEDRPYSPHLTVARLRFPHDVRQALEVAEEISLKVTVSRCTLFKSVLRGGHPLYEPTCSYLLSGHESLRTSRP